MPAQALVTTLPWYWTTCLFALLSLAAPAGASTNAASPRDSGALVVDTSVVEPGQRMTLVFNVDNEGRPGRRVDAQPILPLGWKLISGGGALDLAAGERRPLFIQILVPERAAPGVHVVALETRGGSAGRVLRADSMRVRVRSRRILQVAALDAPRFALAGTDYRSRFLVSNRGNAATRLRIETVEHAGFTTRPSWREALLAAGETRDLDVVVETRTGNARVTRHLLEVLAVAGDRTRNDTTGIARASTTVLVVPQQADVAPRFHRLPMQARVVTTPSRDATGSRPATFGELTGGGTIADDSDTRIDFRLRRGDRHASWSQNDDEYWLTLANDRLAVELGDRFYALSPLTEPGRHATGAAARAQLGGVSLRAFGARDRRSQDRSAALGGSLGYGWHRNARVTGNYVERIGPDSGRTWSMRAQLTPSPLASLDIEAAQALDVALHQPALSILLTGWHPQVSYSVQHIDIPTEFPGSMRGVEHDAASVAIRLTGPIRMKGSLSSQRSMRSRVMPVGGSGADVRTREIGLGVGDGLSVTHASTLASAAAGEDIGAESLVQLRAGGRFASLTLQASALLGHVRTRVDSSWRATFDAGLRAAVRFGRGNHVSAHVQQTTGPRWYATLSQQHSTVGIATRISPVKRITFDLASAGTRATAPQRQTFLTAEGAVSYQAPIGHVISVFMRSHGFLANRLIGPPTLQVAYSVPLGLPVGYSRAGSRVVGRVYDTESGAGIANALVLVGEQMAFTDRDGRVALSGLEAGTQYLQVELSGTVSDHVGMQQLPMLLNTRHGQSARVNVPLVRGSRISGTIRRLAPVSATAWDGSRATLTDTFPVAAMIVTLMRDGEVQRRVTDAAGAFEAAGLRPGRWTVTVDPTDAPPLHYFVQSGVTIDVAPGESATTGFDVLPRKRRVVMIDERRIVADQETGTKRETAILPVPRRNTGAKEAPALPPPVARLTQPTRRGLFNPTEPSYYFVGQSDRTLENVALWIYGDTALWPKLWFANRQQITKPTELRRGTKLLIPPRAPLTGDEIRARDEYIAAARGKP